MIGYTDEMVSEMDWSLAREDQGQAVEVTYAADWESRLMLRRSKDWSIEGEEARAQDVSYECADIDGIDLDAWVPGCDRPDVPSHLWRPMVRVGGRWRVAPVAEVISP